MTISIIIPTLHEKQCIAKTIALSISRAVRNPVEIIVADCGSSDATVDIARRSGATVVTGNKITSRARACNAGAQIATGQVLLFLHADSEPPHGYDQLIRDALSKGAVGGAFEFKLDGPQFRLRVVEWINRIRYRVRRRYFGDQGIFITRKAFDALGGFSDLDILEDAHLCGSAKRLGKMSLITTPMLTSPRRFYNGGILTTLALDIVICVLDWFSIRPRRIAKHYQSDNLKRGDATPGDAARQSNDRPERRKDSPRCATPSLPQMSAT